jgi:hypothetical protein
MSALEVQLRRHRRNRMAFAFYSLGIAGVIGTGGIAFATGHDPVWTTDTKVTVEIETGVLPKPAETGATARPAVTTTAPAVLTAGRVVAPALATSTVPTPTGEQPEPSATTRPPESPEPEVTATTRKPHRSKPSSTPPTSVPPPDPSPTDSSGG